MSKLPPPVLRVCVNANPPFPTHAHAPRRYAFVEYEHEDDMRLAYKRGDGRKIDGRRVLVDVERGRTVRNWLVREPIQFI